MGVVMGGGVALAMIGGWFLALRVMSSKSGWSTIARQYTATGPADGKRYDRATITVGRLFFRRKAIIVGNAEGVYLSLLPYFRPFFPPLFIPWKDLERRGGHTDQVVFGVGAPSIGEIRIPLKVVEETQSG